MIRRKKPKSTAVTCPACQGKRGKTVTEVTNGGTVVRQSWIPCSACKGRGTR